MDIVEAQAGQRRAFVGGGPGVVISGIVWASAGVIESLRGVPAAFAALFLGGMLIFPLSTLVARSVLRRGVASGNPLGAAALESTIAMIAGLFAAWLFLPQKPALVFPLSAIAVGTHYAVFRTVYGERLFLALAALLTGAGLAAIYVKALEGSRMIFAVAAIEIVFGAILTARNLRDANRQP